MPIIVGKQGPVGDPKKLIHWLSSLSADLIQIAEGRGPTRSELQRAPLLAAARFAMRPLPCLVNGEGARDILGPVASGTNVWVIAPDEGWVRTLTGYYRMPSSIERRVS